MDLYFQVELEQRSDQILFNHYQTQKGHSEESSKNIYHWQKSDTMLQEESSKKL